MAEKDILDRALYKRIKSMNKSDMQTFIQNIYNQGFDEALKEDVYGSLGNRNF